MALNLSTLTSSATSGDVLAEALTTADFLEPVPVLRNLARGSQKGGDAKQGTALNQPKALPLDANGKGYLYLSGVTGNYASVPDPIGSLDDFAFQFEGLDAGSVRPLSNITLIAQYENTSNRSFIIIVNPQGKVRVYLYTAADISTQLVYQSALAVPTDTVGIRVTRNGTSLQYWVDTGSGYSLLYTEPVVSGPLYNAGCPIYLGSQLTADTLRGKISRAVIWDNGTASGTPVLDVDFTATNVRHGDTKFKCATGQVVTINQSGNDPATIIKKPVLRFDGVNDFMDGLLNQTVTGGYMFAAFSVLGDGGESHGRIFSMNSTGAADNAAGGFAVYRNALTNGYRSNYNGNTLFPAPGLFDDSLGDVLFESSFKNSSQFSMVNNADKDNGTGTFSGVLSSEEFKISAFTTGGFNAAIDLEYLALFPATITDAQADDVREYIRAKTQVYDLPTPIQNDYSVAFDGTDDYMSMTLPVLGNTHTLSAWFKTTASYGGPGSEGTLISYISSGGGGDDSILSVITNKVGWSDFVDDDQYGTSTVNDGNWHHAVAVVTATTQKIYVDGVLETTTSNAYSAGTNFSFATIGRRANAAQRFFNGNIDEVAIWDSALTANEVKSIYNDGKPVDLSGQPELYSSANNLVAWWRMGDNDSGTGSAVTDNSVNSYNGTLINGPTFQTTTP
jgi:hypothetical protein